MSHKSHTCLIIGTTGSELMRLPLQGNKMSCISGTTFTDSVMTKISDNQGSDVNAYYVTVEIT